MPKFRQNSISSTQFLKYSKMFQTFTGIRQGAASSALLFIAFIDDLVNYLEEHCPPEPILETLHCLLHADDTAILSSRRDLFIDKCNHVLDYFDKNSLSLNLSKSGFLIIGGDNAEKRNLTLKNGVLEYKSRIVYLGVTIGDSGSLNDDTDAYIENKRSNVTIKFGNFCRKNSLAPLDVKLKVLNTCVSAALTYGCETWNRSKVKKVETAFRQGLRTALSIRCCMNNEIVYIESGELPLYIRISKQQLNFWISLQSFLHDHPGHHIKSLINIAGECGYIRYFKELHAKYANPTACENTLKSEFRASITQLIRNENEKDEDSRLGAYFLVNPNLCKPSHDDIIEFQRVCITRYRTGSHNLRIEKGRINTAIERNDRICKCNTGVQTLKHVLLLCPLLGDIRQKYVITDFDSGVHNVDFLLEMERILAIK